MVNFEDLFSNPNSAAFEAMGSVLTTFPYGVMMRRTTTLVTPDSQGESPVRRVLSPGEAPGALAGAVLGAVPPGSALVRENDVLRATASTSRDADGGVRVTASRVFEIGEDDGDFYVSRLSNHVAEADGGLVLLADRTREDVFEFKALTEAGSDLLHELSAPGKVDEGIFDAIFDEGSELSREMGSRLGPLTESCGEAFDQVVFVYKLVDSSKRITASSASVPAGAEGASGPHLDLPEV